MTFTKGRIVIKGSNISRGESKRADYILYYKINIPIAVIEVKDNNHIIGDGMQQALVYAEMLDVQTKQQIVTQNYYSDGSGKVPRYYQTIAINRTIEAIAKGQNRILYLADRKTAFLRHIRLYGSIWIKTSQAGDLRRESRINTARILKIEYTTRKILIRHS